MRFVNCHNSLRTGWTPILLLLLLTAVTAVSCSREDSDPASDDEFVGRESCVSCHEQQAKAYSGSHHDLAMQKATDSTVLADFNGSTFTEDDHKYTFFKENDTFYVRVESRTNEDSDTYPVPYTFGFKPLQQYLLEFPGGRLQALTVAWDPKRGEWFSLHPDRSFEEDNWLHWTRQSQNWNSNCASCHSTNYRKNYNPDSDSYDSTWSEIDVSCEACHGPGSEHVKQVKQEGQTGTGENDRDSAYGLQVDFTSGSVAWRTGSDGVPERVNTDRTVSDAQLSECGRCHGRRSRISKKHRHGDPYLDHFMPSLLREGLYHPDGQVRDEVYIYGSFRQSKMYRKGVRCTDCHNPHSGKLKLKGNKLCTQCHGAEQYDSPDHHHHPESSAGASCVNCHMTEKTFMEKDDRRDHKFHVPRPAQSEKIGSPDACTSCHTDRDPGWASKRITEWTGTKPKSDYGTTFQSAWEGDTTAVPRLRSLLKNPDKPAFLRASAASTLQRFPSPETTNAARGVLNADDPLIRRTAVQLYSTGASGQGRQNSIPDPEPLLPLLDDPVRGVRFAAARSLSTMNLSGADKKKRDRVDQLNEQLEAVLLSLQDTRGGLFGLGQYYQQQGEREKAINFIRRAIELDPKFLDARTLLARLLAREDKPAEAADVLRPVTNQSRPPNMSERMWNRAKGEVFYQLGLLHAGPLENRETARNHLETAVRLSPDHARAHYNLGLLYSKLDRVDLAEQSLKRARELRPDNPQFLYALVTVNRDHGRQQKAIEYAKKLKNQFPDNPRYERIYRLLKRRGR